MVSRVFTPVFLILVSITGAAIGWPTGASAAIEEHEIVVSERQFVPATLVIPADTRVRLLIRNQDSLPVEFESEDLSREVIIPPRGSVPVYIGPLEPGTYEFFDEFNPAARGHIQVDAGKED